MRRCALPSRRSTVRVSHHGARQRDHLRSRSSCPQPCRLVDMGDRCDLQRGSGKNAHVRATNGGPLSARPTPGRTARRLMGATGRRRGESSSVHGPGEGGWGRLDRCRRCWGLRRLRGTPGASADVHRSLLVDTWLGSSTQCPGPCLQRPGSVGLGDRRKRDPLHPAGNLRPDADADPREPLDQSGVGDGWTRDGDREQGLPDHEVRGEGDIASGRARSRRPPVLRRGEEQAGRTPQHVHDCGARERHDLHDRGSGAEQCGLVGIHPGRRRALVAQTGRRCARCGPLTAGDRR